MATTFDRIRSQTALPIPAHWQAIRTIDMHTGGEPLRVIVDGFPELKGNSVLDYRRNCRAEHDHLRQLLMFEPRGHADMYGCILVPPNDPAADFGILFLHNEGYSTMCGHAIIAIATLAVQMAWIEVKEGENELKIDAPCGRILATAHVDQGQVQGVRFQCVPSFVVGLDRSVEVPGLGTLRYDLAYGGAFYAYVDLHKNNLPFGVATEDYRALIAGGMAIKKAVAEADSEVKHPFEADLSFLYGTIFIGDSPHEGIDSRNVCIFAEGEVDRCPTGSGVSGRMAIHHARGELNLGERMSIEGITDSVFMGSVLRTEQFGPYKAVIPQVEGTAYVTGMHTFVLDPHDPIQSGFLLR